MKIFVLIGLILLTLLVIKIFSGRNNNQVNKKYKNETTIDLEKDTKTKEYKPKE